MAHQNASEVKQVFFNKLSQLTKDDYPAIPAPTIGMIVLYEKLLEMEQRIQELTAKIK